MMNRLLHFFVILFCGALTFVFTQQLKASHAAGADISYICNGGNSYTFSLSFYRDCDGISAPTSETLTITSASCGQTLTVSMTQVSSQEVSPLCPAQIGNSTCNGGSLPGIEQYVYEGTITLPQQCTDWLIEYSECCRNNAITNLNAASSYDLYTYATLNNTQGCNDSPQFATLPTPFICANQPFSYNHGATDADGDSLVYTLVNPLDNATTNIPYANPGVNNPTYPMNTVSGVFPFDPATGQMNYEPNGNQVAVIAVLVEEYRNGVLVGSTIRDIQVNVISCTNNVVDVGPITNLAGGTATGNSIQVCPGSTISFDVDASDLDAADIITVGNNITTSIPGAVVTVTGTNPVVFNFQWATTPADVGIYEFAVSYDDGACPIPSVQTIGYEIIVDGVQATTANYELCPGTTSSIQLDIIGGDAGGTYTWTPTTGLSCTNCPNPIATVSDTITYFISYSDGLCQTNTSISITSPYDLVVSPDVNLCGSGSSAQLDATYTFPPPVLPACGLNTSSCGTTAQNFDIGTATSNSGTTCTGGGIGTPYMGYYHDMRLQLLYTAAELNAAGVNAGLINSLSFNVLNKLSSAPFNDFTIKIACTNETSLSTGVGYLTGLTTVYTANYTTTAGWNDHIFPVSYEWDGTQNLVIEICYNNTGFTCYDHTSTTNTAFNSVLYQRADNQIGCALAIPTASVVRPDIRFNVCDLPAFNETYTWTPTNDLSCTNCPNPVASPATTTVYYVTASDGVCAITDSIVVANSPAPVLDPITSQTICAGQQTSLTVTGANLIGATYTWNPGGLDGQTVNVTPGSTTTYTVSVDNGCGVDTETVTVNVGQAFPVAMDSTDASCLGGSDGSATATPSGGTAPYTYQWDANTGNQTTPTATGLGAGTFVVTVTDDVGCESVDSIRVNQPTGLGSSIVQDSVSCNGGSDGAIDLTISGGITPYTFTWAGGIPPVEDPTGLSAGIYSVTVVDNTGNCVVLDTIEVLEPSLVSASNTTQDAACNGIGTGQSTINPSGGTAPYTYQWDASAGNQTTQTATGLGQGLYQYTVTDFNGCTFVGLDTISQPTALAFTSGQDSVLCNGDATGSAYVSPTGGVGPYTYLWDVNAANQTTDTATNLAAGSYDVTITDVNGCDTTATVSVFEPQVLGVGVIGFDNPQCNGDSTGTISTTTQGGTLPYTYLWSNTETTSNISDLPAGFYGLTVTDGNGCTATASTTLFEPTALTSTTSSVDASCSGSFDGEVSVVANGGTSPFTYAWSTTPISTTDNVTGLDVGTYYVTVTDAQGCTQIDSATVGSVVILVDNEVLTNLTCFEGGDGAISVTPSGSPNTPYTYTWSPNTGVPVSSGPSATINGLDTGTFVLVISDAAGCNITETYVLTQPTEVEASISSQDSVSCFTGNDGSATASASGGTVAGAYTFQWDAAAGNQTTPTATGLSAGTYTVTVTDDNNCSDTAIVTILEPAEVQVSLISQQATSCPDTDDGEAVVSVIGGTQPYTYSWPSGETTANPVLLPDGANLVTVTDANGCQDTLTVFIAEPSTVIIQLTGTDITCNGGSDGAITTTNSGGTPPYTYTWDNALATGQNPTNLPAGIYNLTLTDNNGCEYFASDTLNEPTAVSGSISTSDVSCFGLSDGSAIAVGSGGVGPYTYNWSNTATGDTATGFGFGSHDVTITDASGCTHIEPFSISQPTQIVATITGQTPVSCFGLANGTATISASGGTTPPAYSFLWDSNASNQTTATATGLEVGTYSVTVTDGNGCTDSTTVTITSPNAVDVTLVSQTTTSCANVDDGSAVVSVTGGTTPYTYAWDNGETTANPVLLPDGPNFLTVTDGNGCTDTLTVFIAEPSAVVIQLTGTDISCNAGNDGTITTTASGGTQPYTFTWSSPLAVGQDPVGLTAGTYDLTLTDANGCQFFDNITLTEPSAVTVAVTPTDATCFGQFNGSATALGAGGTPPYNYVWSNSVIGATTSGLPAGSHSVTITDDNGCQASTSFQINEPTELLPTGFPVTIPSCNGASDGVAGVEMTGGVTPYTYQWDASTGGQTGQFATGLPAGLYEVIITDANGCQFPNPLPVLVTEPDSLLATATSLNITCNGQADGSTTVVATGGTSPYTYLWDDPLAQTTATATGLDIGTYNVLVTDANGCTTTAQAEVFEPEPIYFEVSNTPAICFESADATITVDTAEGGAGGPFTYSLDDVTYQTPNQFVGLTSGYYTVYVQDVAGCIDSTSIYVDQPLPLVVGFNPDVVELELGDSVQVFAQTNTDSTLFDFTWTPTTYLNCVDCPNPIITPLESTTYVVTITDSLGCEATSTVVVNVDKNRNLFVPNAFSPNGDSNNDVFMVFGSTGLVQVDKFIVYDRWGEVMHEATNFQPNDPQYGWDGIFRGKAMNPAVFVWYVEATFTDGLTKTYKGDVTLIR